MSIVKSFSVGDGDMFYIQHNCKCFSIIDCCIDESNREKIVAEIKSMQSQKNITRFISTHPDDDHIRGLEYLDEKLGIVNFYCVDNASKKDDPTDDFNHYCQLKNGSKHYYLFKGCKRKWLNSYDSADKNDNGSSGIECLWPNVNNADYKATLEKVKSGSDFNNISPIITYSLQNGASFIWMGDLEQDLLEKVKSEIDWPSIDVLFAPHHGRKTGKVFSDVLRDLSPKLVIIGEAPSEHLDYYNGYNTITQNTAGDIILDCDVGYIHIYLSNANYKYDTSFLEQKSKPNTNLGVYIGSLKTKEG